MNLASPIQTLADAINDLSPEKLQQYANTVKNIAIGIGGVVAARKIFRGGQGLYDILSPAKSKSGGSLPSAGGLGSAGATPVYVTNWQDSSGGAKDLLGKFGKMGAIGGALSAATSVESARQKFLTDFKNSGKEPPEFKPLFGLTEKPQKSADLPQLNSYLKGGKSEVVVKIETTDGLKVKSTSSKSDDARLAVIAGNTYLRGY